MSWSLHIQVTDVNALDDLADLADRLIEANGDIPDGVTVSPITSPRWESDEHQMQLRAAIDAARALINVAGRPGDRYNLNLSGHGNPGFAPTDGWSDCTVTVSVSQIPHEKIAADE